MTGRAAERAKIAQSHGVVIPAVREMLLKERAKPSTRRADVVHPSEMAKSSWCHRATYYRVNGARVPPEDVPFSLESVFQEGHLIHDKWQGWLARTGRLWGDWQCARCLSVIRRSTVEKWNEKMPCYQIFNYEHDWKYLEVALWDENLNIAGFEDAAVGDCLVELKSVGVGTLRKEASSLLSRYYVTTSTGSSIYDLDLLWRDLRQPFPSHLRQANVYLWLAREMGLDVSRGAVVYEFKPNQQAKEFMIRLNMDIVQPLLDLAQEIKDGTARGEAPDCRFGGCEECRAYERAIADSRDRAAAGAFRDGGLGDDGAGRDEEREAPCRDGQDKALVEAGEGAL